MFVGSSAAAAGGGGVFPPPMDPSMPGELAYVRGPTPTSNWVIRGRVCCGAAPNAQQPRYAEALGRERFAFLICLMEKEPEPAVIDMIAASAGGFRPQLMHFPMVDGTAFQSALQANDFLAFCRRLVATLETEPLARAYIFCHGGHGRTGMFVSCLLALAYGLNGMRAVNMCSRLHDARVNTMGQSSPQTQEQRTAVLTLLKQQA